MHKTLLYIHVYVIGILRKQFFFFFYVTCFELPVSIREEKDGRERKQERGRDAPSTKHVRL